MAKFLTREEAIERAQRAVAEIKAALKKRDDAARPRVTWAPEKRAASESVGGAWFRWTTARGERAEWVLVFKGRETPVSCDRDAWYCTNVQASLHSSLPFLRATANVTWTVTRKNFATAFAAKMVEAWDAELEQAREQEDRAEKAFDRWREKVLGLKGDDVYGCDPQGIDLERDSTFGSITLTVRYHSRPVLEKAIAALRSVLPPKHEDD